MWEVNGWKGWMLVEQELGEEEGGHVGMSVDHAKRVPFQPNVASPSPLLEVNERVFALAWHGGGVAYAGVLAGEGSGRAASPLQRALIH